MTTISLGGTVDGDLEFWVGVWLLVALFLVLRHWRQGRGVGLVLVYVVSFGAMHWLSAAVYVLPWYSGPGQERVAAGMRESALAMLALAVGSEFALLWLPKREGVGASLGDAGQDEDPEQLEERTQEEEEEEEDETTDGHHGLPMNPVAPTLYLVTGLVLYGVITPLVGGMATVVALVNTGSALMVVGLLLKCWNGLRTNNDREVWTWFGVSVAAPLITVAVQGFLGYGMAIVVLIGAFIAATYGPRLKVLALSALMAYGGLSVYVTYMRDREEIRAVVWAGGSMNDRLSRITGTVTNFEWFDLHSTTHLDRLEVRLDQDTLVGNAIAHMRDADIPFAEGSTFFDAAVALVPRAIWPSKPVTAGSGDLVAQYTGLDFSQSTSVGVGQLLEAYINFGTPSVLVVFFLIGVGLVVVDHSARDALIRGDAAAFTIWYMPGLSLLLVGGSFAEATSGAASAWVMAWALSKVLLRFRAPIEDEDELEDAPHDYPARDAPETWR